MMLEDKLTRAERIRLESFAQACQSRGMGVGQTSLIDLFHIAEQIEAWLRLAREDA